MSVVLVRSNAAAIADHVRDVILVHSNIAEIIDIMRITFIGSIFSI